MSKIAAIIGRLLIAIIFIVSGIGKLADPSSTAQMLATAGLLPALAIPTGLFELVAGLMLAFAHSQMWSHYHGLTRQRRGEVAAPDAEQRAHDAELRAARAEGAMAAAKTDPVVVDRNRDGYVDPVVTRRRQWFDW